MRHPCASLCHPRGQHVSSAAGVCGRCRRLPVVRHTAAAAAVWRPLCDGVLCSAVLLSCRPHTNGHAGRMPPPVQYAMFPVGPDGRPLGPPVGVPPVAGAVAPPPFGGPPVPQHMHYMRPPPPGGPPQPMAMPGWGHVPRPPMHAPPPSPGSQMPAQAFVGYVAPGYVPATPGMVEPSFGAKLQAALGPSPHQHAPVMHHAAIHHAPAVPAWAGSPGGPSNGAEAGQGRGARGRVRAQRGRSGRVNRNSG